MWVRPLGRENPLEEGMATHSSILACRIPWTEEPGALVYAAAKSRTRLKLIHKTQYSWKACKELGALLCELTFARIRATNVLP